LLVSKFDPLLRTHIQNVAKQRQGRIKNSNYRGRGNLVTFLSTTSANSIIMTISKLIKQKIAEEINAAKIFSIQIDTTQDINVINVQ
jgi:hypothetical protein